MQINSKGDDRDVLLMAISGLTESHRLGKFVVIFQEESRTGLSIYYSDEIHDSITLMEEALEMQKKV